MKVFFTLAIFTQLVILSRADFHVSTLDNIDITSGSSADSYTSMVACPSNNYNCGCLTGSSGKQVSDSSSTYYQIASGLCGMGAPLNVYRNDDGSGIWTIFVAGGDGSVQGTCLQTDKETNECSFFGGTATVMRDMTCSSYICNP